MEKHPAGHRTCGVFGFGSAAGASFDALEQIGGVVVAFGLVDGDQCRNPAHEIVVILAVVGPARLGESRHARQDHVLCVADVRDVLRPEVALHAPDPFLVGQREPVAGVEAVSLPHRDVAGVAQRFVTLRVGGLAVIEVAVPFRWVCIQRSMRWMK